jgi:hypothetical protein
VKRFVALACAVTLLSAAASAAAQAGSGGGGPSDAGVGDKKVWSSCVDYVPKGATPPHIETKLPGRGLSGYAVELIVVVSHGPGETVMPDGFRIQRGSDAMLALTDAHWVLPEPDGGVAPLIDRPKPAADATSATTTVTIPFVPLPEEGGRHLMTLPPVPISVARANGQVMTLCTDSMRITIDDPIANEVDPQVRPNPPPRPQREEWTAAKQATQIALGVLLLAALLAYLMNRFRKRPKPVPAKPKELPWVLAMRRLDSVRTSGLIGDEQFEDYFDRVDHTTRQYLGDRYGFDGLESTSEEIRDSLKRVYPAITCLDLIERFLTDSDFVKYADVEPSRDECTDAMARATEIVRVTTPMTIQPRKKSKKRKKKSNRRAA